MVSQQQFINYLLASKDFTSITENNLGPEYFFNYKTEFNFIKNHYDQYKAVPDIETFKATFPDFEIIEVKEPKNYLLEKLYEDYNASYLATRFNNIKDYLEKGEVNKAMDYFKRSVSNLHSSSAIHCTDLIQDHSRYEAFMERSLNHTKAYIRTGFKELDERIGGIDCLEENMVIAARTGIGKSWTLVKLAAEASKQGKVVGIYEGEMSANKLGYRIDTVLGGISNSSITRGDGNVAAQLQYKNYIDSLPTKGYGPIKIITPNDISGPATVSALQAFVEREKLDILFIDQYSLLEDTSKTFVMHERIANISKAIKNLQVMKKIPIVSVSQMNRTKNEDGTQDTTQIGLSDRIGQDATVVLMLDKKDDQLIINIVKSRDGGDGKKLIYQTDFNSGIFNYIDIAEDKQKAQETKDSYR